MLAVQIVTENAKMVMFTSLVVLLGIICVVANIDYYSENGSMIPVVINTWPFTNATQNGKNSHVTIEIGGGFRCDNCIRRVWKRLASLLKFYRISHFLDELLDKSVACEKKCDLRQAGKQSTVVEYGPGTDKVWMHSHL
jgi:hypothetical protein